MAFWSKLKFWGEKNDIAPMPAEFGNMPDFNQGFNQGFNPQSGFPGQGMNASIDQPFRQGQYPTFEPMSQNQQPPPIRSYPGSSMTQPEFASPGKDMNMEVVSAKLDALRASLESINQRLANLERIAYQDYEPPQKRTRW